MSLVQPKMLGLTMTPRPDGTYRLRGEHRVQYWGTVAGQAHLQPLSRVHRLDSDLRPWNTCGTVPEGN